MEILSRSYRLSNRPLSTGNSNPPALVKALQRDLRALGYLSEGIDGWYGPATCAAVRSLQYDLTHPKPVPAAGPVRVADYSRERVHAVDGAVDRALVDCIAEMMADDKFPKLPRSANATQENKRVLASLKSMGSSGVPVPFLLAILEQESGFRHFSVPQGQDEDDYVTVGLDRNDARNPDRITSRGYGVGQYTFFHHPPTPSEIAEFILDPVANTLHIVSSFKEKFEGAVLASDARCRADDRIQEVGEQPLRTCRYNVADARYMTDCQACMRQAGLQTILAGITALFAGSSQRYRATKYHRETRYINVPIRANILCDWPYAARRYNGSGVDSYHYQTQVLLKVLSGPQLPNW
ncbi:MAG: peptidoglycan-binding protein [Candidatus Hydrogenedentes bacterium]|nr:peptidoglycan-binding protein [Candidatus Hydrogenedentota bacterium]